MLLLNKGVQDATLKLVCPHCKKHQLRAKKPRKTDVYACKHCHKRFARAEGERGVQRR